MLKFGFQLQTFPTGNMPQHFNANKVGLSSHGSIMP